MQYVAIYNSKESEKYKEALTAVFKPLNTLYIQTSSELGKLQRKIF